MATASLLLRLVFLSGLLLMAVAHGDDDDTGDEDDIVGNDRTFEHDNLNNSGFPTRIMVNYGVSMASIGLLFRIAWLMFKKRQ